MSTFNSFDYSMVFEPSNELSFEHPLKDLFDDPFYQTTQHNETPSKTFTIQTQIYTQPTKEQSVDESLQSSTDEDSYSEEESSTDDDFVNVSTPRKSSIPWLPVEDETLKELALKYEFKNWAKVAHDLYKEFPQRPRRTCNQCNQRWMRVLNPRITKGKWELEEDKKLATAILQSPPKKWKQIANLMPGRTDIQVRYRIKKISGWLLKQGVPKECLVV